MPKDTKKEVAAIDAPAEHIRVPKVHQPATVEPLPPAAAAPKTAEPTPYNTKNVVTMISLDKDGNEVGEPFQTNLFAAQNFYGDVTKFKIKKKVI